MYHCLRFLNLYEFSFTEHIYYLNKVFNNLLILRSNILNISLRSDKLRLLKLLTFKISEIPNSRDIVELGLKLKSTCFNLVAKMIDFSPISGLCILMSIKVSEEQIGCPCSLWQEEFKKASTQ